MKTYLAGVTFEEKEIVKRLGARWDPARKQWFVPDGVDLVPFLAWVPGTQGLSKEIQKVLGRRI